LKIINLQAAGASHNLEDYGEILSLAVEPSLARQGIGSKILKACEEEARTLGLNKLITLTYVPEFLNRMVCQSEKEHAPA